MKKKPRENPMDSARTLRSQIYEYSSKREKNRVYSVVILTIGALSLLTLWNSL